MPSLKCRYSWPHHQISYAVWTPQPLGKLEPASPHSLPRKSAPTWNSHVSDSLLLRLKYFLQWKWISWESFCTNADIFRYCRIMGRRGFAYIAELKSPRGWRREATWYRESQVLRRPPSSCRRNARALELRRRVSSSLPCCLRMRLRRTMSLVSIHHQRSAKWTCGGKDLVNLTYLENRGLLICKKVSSVKSLRDRHLLSISLASSGFPIRNNVLAMLLYELPMPSPLLRRRISIALCPVSTALTKSPNSVYAREMAFRLEAMKASSTDFLSDFQSH